MRAFDCMRRVRAREVVARAYGDAGIRCADRAARRLWCDGESWPSCTEAGRRSTATRFELGAAATKLTLRFVEVASRSGGSATASRSPAAGGSAASAHGLLDGSGGSDAAGAAAAGLVARLARRRWRAFPVASAAPGLCCSLDWQSEEWRVADGSAGLALASCSSARGLYGAFVVAGAAPDRRQLPLSGGGLALDAGNTPLTLRTLLAGEPEAPVAHEGTPFMKISGTPSLFQFHLPCCLTEASSPGCSNLDCNTTEGVGPTVSNPPPPASAQPLTPNLGWALSRLEAEGEGVEGWLRGLLIIGYIGPRGPVSGNGRTWPEPNGSGRRGSAATGSGATMSPVRNLHRAAELGAARAP
eukprot:scaffold5617_cov57-Phaeocystis_antarctica.AAC.1